MHHYRRKWIAALLMTGLANSAIAVMDAPTIDQQKKQVVQNVVSKLSGTKQVNDVLAAVNDAHALVNLHWQKNNNLDVLQIDVTDVPQCNTFSLDDGKRLVIDLENTINLRSGMSLDLQLQSKVTGLRTSLFAYQPKFISRIALDLQQPYDFYVESTVSRVIIHLTAKVEGRNIIQLLDGGVGNADSESLRIEIVKVTPIPKQERTLLATDSKAEILVEKLYDQLTTLAHRAPAEVKTVQKPQSVTEKEEVLPKRIHTAKRAEKTEQPYYGNTTRASIAVQPIRRIARVPQQRQREQTIRLTQELEAVSAAKIDLGMNLLHVDADTLKLADIEVFTDETAEEGNTESEVIPLFLAQTEEPEEEESVTQEETPVEAEAPEQAVSEEEIPAPAENEETSISEEEAAEPAAPQQDEATPPGPREDSSETTDTIEANKTLFREMNLLIDTLTAPADVDADAATIAIAEEELEVIEATDGEPVVSILPAPYQGDPMEQPVWLSFNEVSVSQIVSLLARKADINVIASADLSQLVSLELSGIPLRQAMETALRITGKGLMEEEGIYHIVPYAEAISAGRVQRIITLNNAKASDIQSIVDATIVGTRNASHIAITANDAAQLVVISAPEGRIRELVDLVHQLDIAPQVSPTEIKAIKLNFADPNEIVAAAQAVLTQGIGTVTANVNTRHVIVNDLPVVVEQIEALVAQLDVAVKRVAIDSLLVDVSLNDDAETGVDWLFNAVQNQTRSQVNLGQPGNVRGRLQDISMLTPFGLGSAVSGLTFGILGKKFDLRGTIQAEIRNRNGRLISNPQLVTIENQTATLEIIQDIPYIELTSTEAGGQQTSTSFKKVGTVLNVTPRVTHDNQIIAAISVKESDTVGEFNGVPIEELRTINTTVRMQSGETIFMAGARKKDNDTSVRRLPILGDLPVINFLFRQNVRTESIRELLIFITCTVIPDDVQITPYQEEKFDKASGITIKVDAQRGLFHDMIHPEEMRDPAWKWRRTD